ncbi:hypothetical protein, partial [Microbacterium sp. MYb72]|uniref:hypothetical protein n=1 Tax=Microbacterium sp. MYb72 TaxID=1848693 RepID=UPI001C611313
LERLHILTRAGIPPCCRRPCRPAVLPDHPVEGSRSVGCRGLDAAFLDPSARKSLITAALKQQRISDDRTNIGRDAGNRPISATSSEERDEPDEPDDSRSDRPRAATRAAAD